MSVAVTAAAGVQEDFRGVVRRGKAPRRQVSLIEAESRAAALCELDDFEGDGLPWHVRRGTCAFPACACRASRARSSRSGSSRRIGLAMECDPCSRMDEIRPGRRAALTPDWRGGVLGPVLDDGEIAV
ncbi:MAG: MOSC domain-containing protein [Novosphingobium sp.]